MVENGRQAQRRDNQLVWFIVLFKIDLFRKNDGQPMEWRGMKTKPVLFNGEMVQALLAGTKTQTRRPLNKQPDSRHCRIDFENGILKESSMVAGCWQVGRTWQSPFAADYLWVRETFFDSQRHPSSVLFGMLKGGVAYRADDTFIGPFHNWSPSIHMPRKLSRLTLPVVAYKIERLHEITGSDVLAEGIDNGKSNPTMGARWENMQRVAFEKVWDSIYGNDFPWESNPWVHVCEFTVVGQNIDEVLRSTHNRRQ